MSFTSPQSAASAEAARFNATQANSLADLSLPAIQQALSGVFNDINVSANGQIGVPKSVAGQYGQIATATDQDYSMIGRGNNAFSIQSAKTSGQPYTSTMVSDEILSSGRTLEASRRGAQENIAYQEQVSGLDEYDNLLSLLAGGSGAALNLASGFAGQQATAIGGLSAQSPGGGALGGALAGGSAGSVAGPYGAIIGALAGGLGGYFSAGG